MAQPVGLLRVGRGQPHLKVVAVERRCAGIGVQSAHAWIARLAQQASAAYSTGTTGTVLPAKNTFGVGKGYVNHLSGYPAETMILRLLRFFAATQLWH